MNDPAPAMRSRVTRHIDSMSLLAGLLALVIVPPTVRPQWQHPVTVALLTAVLIFGTLSVRASGKAFRLVVAMAVPAALLTWNTQSANSLMPLAISLYFAALLSVIYLTMQHAFRREVVTTDKILASINAYLMVAAAFAMFYNMVELVSPDSFTGNVASQSFPYFSLVTQTTVGFGDITPTNPTVRALVGLQAVFGQFYLAILVARLVALHVSQEAE